MKFWGSTVAIASATLPVVLLFSASARAEQYTHCYPVEKVRVIKDSGNHPNAYDDGYREGVEDAREGKEYEPRSAGGEFARGFDDGYYGRPYTGQQNTIPNRRENYTSRQCSTYYYDKDDSIEEILRSVLNQYENDRERR